ncbi:MAG: hypothetical protein ACR2OV_15920 [Hyphomicrobiaceae bacterium]
MSFLICTPMYGGQCTAAYFQSCLNLKDGLRDAGVPHDWHVITNESLIPRARNEHARAFLESEYEALLFIDADIEFTEEDVAKLWNMDQDVAVGCYPMKKPGAPYAAWRQGKLVELETLESMHGPFQVDYAGTGFMLIRRNVFERLRDEQEETGFLEYETKDGKTAWNFFPIEVRNECLLSEDYCFCQNWTDLGGSIWMDPSVRLKHHGSYAYGDSGTVC